MLPKIAAAKFGDRTSTHDDVDDVDVIDDTDASAGADVESGYTIVVAPPRVTTLQWELDKNPGVDACRKNNGKGGMQPWCTHWLKRPSMGAVHAGKCAWTKCSGCSTPSHRIDMDSFVANVHECRNWCTWGSWAGGNL